MEHLNDQPVLRYAKLFDCGFSSACRGPPQLRVSLLRLFTYSLASGTSSCLVGIAWYPVALVGLSVIMNEVAASVHVHGPALPFLVKCL